MQSRADGEAQDACPGRAVDGAWRTISLGLKLLVSAAAFWLLACQADMGAQGGVLSASDWTLFCAGAVAYVVGQAFSAYRWLVIARRVGFSRRLIQLVRYYFVGMFFNLVGPATVGGDLVRGLYLAGEEDRRSAALNTVVFDRLVGLVMLVFVLLVAIASFGNVRVAVDRGRCGRCGRQRGRRDRRWLVDPAAAGQRSAAAGQSVAAIGRGGARSAVA